MDMNGSSAIDLLQREISNPDTQWSLGTFGAIAEFSRNRDEPVALWHSEHGVSAVTPRGGIALKHHPRSRAFASESVTKTGWTQRVALCLPEEDCAMHGRTVLTKLGADGEALRPEDRESVLFDLGLGALPADFCVRVDDRDTSARLREHTGRAVFEPGNPAMGMILAANPHRVFLSRLGRIEVYQPIPPALGKEPGRPAHPCPAQAPEQQAHAFRDRARSGGLDSLRASLSGASGARCAGGAPAVRCGPP